MSKTTEVCERVLLTIIKAVRKEIEPDLWFNITEHGMLIKTSDSHDAMYIKLEVNFEDESPCVQCNGGKSFDLQDPDYLQKVVAHVAVQFARSYINKERTKETPYVEDVIKKYTKTLPPYNNSPYWSDNSSGLTKYIKTSGANSDSTPF